MKRSAQFAFALLVASFNVPVAVAQDRLPEDRVISIRFDEWVSARNAQGIPCQFAVLPASLRYEQRITVMVTASVDGKKLKKLGPAHEFYMVVRFANPNTHHWIEQGWTTTRLERDIPNNKNLQFALSFYVIPGEYEVGAVLYDQTTDRHSAFKKAIRVNPIDKDPLPGAFSSLPRVQLLPAAEGLENYYNPKIQSRLALPVRSARPVHFEVLIVLGEIEQRLPRGYGLGFALSSLRVLTQLQIPNAQYHVTLVDPIRQQVIHEQNQKQGINWTSLTEATSSLNPYQISLKELEGFKQNAEYLSGVLAQHLQEPLPDAGGQRPLKVLVLIGSPMSFPAGTVRKPVPREIRGDTLFYQLRYHPFSFSRPVRFFPNSQPFSISNSFDYMFRDFYTFDDFDKVLKPIQPKKYDIAAPFNLREALADLIAAIEKQSEAPGTIARQPL